MRIDEICRILYRYIEHIPATNEQKLVGLVCTLVLLLVLLLANPPTWTGVTQTAHRAAMGFTLFLLGWLGYTFYRLYGTDYEPNANYFIFCSIYLGSIGVASCGLAFCFEAIGDYFKGSPTGIRNLYQPSQGIPSPTSSQKKVLKLKKLTERVDAETVYLESARRNVKARALWQYTKQLAKRRA